MAVSSRFLPVFLSCLCRQLGDGWQADPGERRRAQSAARRHPAEEEEEGHQLVLLRLHGPDRGGVHPAHGGPRREQPRHAAAGGGRELDGGAGSESYQSTKPRWSYVTLQTL